MSTYADRLAHAMRMRGMDPSKSQSQLAKLVGHGCKPQNIQHLLDPNKNAKSSKYTARIAAVLEVDPEWLAYESGEAPSVRAPGTELTVQQAEVDAAQRQEAVRLLETLSGSKLSRALAALQDLARSGDYGGLIIGGEADLAGSGLTKRTGSSQ